MYPFKSDFFVENNIFFWYKYTLDCYLWRARLLRFPFLKHPQFKTPGSIPSPSTNTWAVSKRSLCDSASASTVKYEQKDSTFQLNWGLYQSFLSTPHRGQRTSPQVRTEEMQIYCIHPSFCFVLGFFSGLRCKVVWIQAEHVQAATMLI